VVFDVADGFCFLEAKQVLPSSYVFAGHDTFVSHQGITGHELKLSKRVHSEGSRTEVVIVDDPIGYRCRYCDARGLAINMRWKLVVDGE
jgi:hypothetical protein